MAPKGHAHRVLASLDGSQAALSSVAASWRRCVTMHGLDPERRVAPHVLSSAELRQARDGMGAILPAAQASLDALFKAVGHAGCCVLLTDANGAPVDRRGEAGDDAAFRLWGLWTGVVWSEAAEGTNGVGTCLAEQRPLTIHRDEHFHTKNIGLSCTVAPIYDPWGRLAGALDVSSCRPGLGDMVELLRSAVLDAARRIEAEAFRQTFPNTRLMMLGEPGARSSTPLLAVDGDDMVVGATHAARKAARLTDQMIQWGASASDLMAGPEGAGRSDLVEAERGAVKRALSRSGGSVSAAARELGVSRATLHRKMKRLDLHRPSKDA